MSSMSGYINYLKFTAGVTKGNVQAGTVFNDPFRLGKVDPNYTSSRVNVDTTLTAAQTVFNMDWKPVISGTINVAVTVDGATTNYVDIANGVLVAVPEGGKVSHRTVMVQPAEDTASGIYGDTRLEGVESYVETVVTNNAGAVVNVAAGQVDYAAGTITFNAEVAAGSTVSVSYTYNNVVIPQNDLPLLTAKMEAMPLIARARRIAIYYSQMAAFQAKTDYGVDLGDQLAEKAVGQLAYEIDTEVTNLLVNNAAVDTSLTFSKTLPLGVSKAEHYEGFSEIVALADSIIYQKTQRYKANYMLISPTILPILGFVKGWTAAPATRINGPYFAGTLNGVKVYVTPNIEAGKFVLGVNDGDFNASAAVYAPYMPIVPTQLLGHADGSMSQGWSTLYDLRLLNKDLLVAGQVIA